ncbi:unnamed protein product, partial [Mesorhabditis spiculigera]
MLLLVKILTLRFGMQNETAVDDAMDWVWNTTLAPSTVYRRPEMFYNIVNISKVVPLDWAIPLYGKVMPLLVIVTTVTNCFIVFADWLDLDPVVRALLLFRRL